MSFTLSFTKFKTQKLLPLHDSFFMINCPSIASFILNSSLFMKESCPDFGCYLCQFVGRRGEFGLVEIDIRLGIHRHQVDMGMGHFQSYYGLSHLSARDGLPNCLCHALCKYLESCQFLVVHIENLVDFALGNHQSVSHSHRVDVEKSKKAVVFRTTMAGNFACCNFRKDCHC